MLRNIHIFCASRIKRKIIFILILINFFSLGISAQPEQVKVDNSQIKTFTSSIVSGQQYVLQIMLPAGYEKNNQKFPVLFLMDSQWDFPLVTALYGEQYFDGFIPAAIIVGITWGGAHPNPDSLRARDYTPTNEKGLPQSGGADKFLSVIKNEIFPFVESNYRVDMNNKTLIGCSLGGLFTLYTLFTHPGMFNRYVAASPAFSWDNSILYQYEKKYYANTTNTPAKLFICVGGVELSAPGFEELASFLNNRHYTSLEIESKVLENTGHSGTKGEGYARGLQFVFKRPSLQLSSNILNPYNGTYKLNDGTRIEIKTVNDSLTASTGNNSFRLLAASETDFYLTSSFLKMHFIKDEKGNVSGFELARYGSTEIADKIK